MSKYYKLSVSPHFTDPIKYVVSAICPFCGKVTTFEVDKEVWNRGVKAYEDDGKLIQDAWPTLTPSQREAILTGICDDCWNIM